MKITNLNCEYVGGGIYIITGKVDDEWFLARSDYNYLDIVDGDYHSIEWDGSYEDTNWHNTHYLRTPSNSEKIIMFRVIFSEIINKFYDVSLYKSLSKNWFTQTEEKSNNIYTICEFDVMNMTTNQYTGTVNELAQMFNNKLVRGRYSKSWKWTRKASIYPQNIHSLVKSLNRAEKNLSLFDKVTMHVYTLK